MTKDRLTAARFVVRRHRATPLQFDFRLEVDGVLMSWAIPKGPSLDPRDRRLAVRVEERVHSSGFVVWDTGTYRNLTAPVSMGAAVAGGLVNVWLTGEKLSGAYSLTRTNTRAGRQEKWLLVKRGDVATVQ